MILYEFLMQFSMMSQPKASFMKKRSNNIFKIKIVKPRDSNLHFRISRTPNPK
jgi:hypothetical protein